MWNAHAYDLLDVPVQVDPIAEAQAAAFESRWGFAMPAAVREWVVGDWRDWARGPSVDLPPMYHQLEMLSEEEPGSRLMVVDRDSQGCCAFVVSVDDHDDPPVLVLERDDTTGESRSTYTHQFTAFTHAMAWDLKLWRANFESRHYLPLPANALSWLQARLEPRPTTYHWAGNQWCDAVHRFGGPAAVMVAVEADRIQYSLVVCDDVRLRDEIHSVLWP
ncbi:hypothetical protein [Catellatospora sp. NPDC049133]|uniref:hypothetical protein n=1 Tax=Catellatospora sp. NPDC049133 TaxID=3155499 RepID=UPI0033DF0652